ncbi:acyltransferase [Arcobacter sp. FWKO B]|uniref:acyltransferase n=1 Tax=Arcobacter sp. FWKO B TaxID=2593672 RepID=UPI0018A67B25|nr:acyltransferase [Arcobacter sp. FWKO B]QOG11495.1 acyltransferase [Arcobacter sp. FWKO B]
MENISLFKRLTNKFKVMKNNNINISKNTKISGCTIIIKGNNNHLIIKENTILRKTTLEIIGNNCTIQIGKNCMIGHYCYLSTKEEGTNLIIEDDCGLSRNVKIMTSDGHPIFQNNIRCNEPQSILIEKHVWIADNVTILKGVNIGTGSVIGINSTVTKNIPPNSVAAGNPARIIKNNISWES